MENKVKISVALCTYNGARYLNSQLDSILDQARPVDELVICDERSEDGTAEILETYRRQYPDKISVYINPVRLGIKNNFEKAIRLCKGDIIFLSDQDDIWVQNKTEKVLAYFREHPGMDVIFTNAYILENDKRSEKNAWSLLAFSGERKARLYDPEELLKHLFLKWNIATGATMALRKPVAVLHLPFADFEKYLHDYLLALQAAAAGSLGFIDECLIGYRLHSEQQVGIQSPVRPLLLRPFYKIRYLLKKLIMAPARRKEKRALAKHLKNFVNSRFQAGKIFIDQQL